MQRKEVLIHYSAKPLKRIESREQDAPVAFYQKPKGLWVSVKGPGDWAEWCRGENFAVEHLVLAHQIILTERAPILRVVSAAGIDKLTRVYGVEVGIGRCRTIDWRRIAKRYAGIVIAPYIYSRRMEFDSSWYYPWDCASGCIWDRSAVADIRLIEGSASPAKPK